MALYTQEQLDAITTSETKAGILAGAGAGKTHTLAGRVAELLQRGVEPEKIAVFTFTNKAANELKARLEAQLGCDSSKLTVGTFHAVAYEMHPYNPRVISPEEEGMIYRKHANDDAAVRSEKRLKNLASYEDLLVFLGTQIGLDQVDWEHVVVDEAQDTDELQWEIIDMLVQRGTNLFAVGDTRQNIYQWRGAKTENFVARIDKMLPLSTTFRFSDEGCDLSNALAAKAGDDSPKLLPPPLWKNIPGEVQTSELDPVDAYLLLQKNGWDPEDVAILCHTNREVSLIRSGLAAEGVALAMDPRVIRGSVWMELLRWIACPSEMSDKLVAFLDKNFDLKGEFAYDENPLLSRVIVQSWIEMDNVRPTVESICQKLKLKWKGDDKDLELLDLLIEEIGTEGFYEGVNALSIEGLQLQSQPVGVTVCTVHQSKGLEWPAVIAVDSAFRPKAETLRTCYVQSTRHTEKLVICGAYGPLHECARELGFKSTSEGVSFGTRNK